MIYEIRPKQSPFLRMVFERKYVTLIEYSGYNDKVVNWCEKKQAKKNRDAAEFIWHTDELYPIKNTD